MGSPLTLRHAEVILQIGGRYTEERSMDISGNHSGVELGLGGWCHVSVWGKSEQSVTLYSGSQFVELFFAVSTSTYDNTHHRWCCLLVRWQWGGYAPEIFCVQYKVSLAHL